jgi:hypothetical protein
MGVSFSRVDPTRPEGERRAGRVVRVGEWANCRRNYGARFQGGQIAAKKKSGPFGPDATITITMEDLMPIYLDQAASSGSVVTHGYSGSVFSIDPLPMVIPIKRTVMVPPANKPNSESWRPQSAPAMPSPNRAMIEPICPLEDQGVDRGMSRFKHRPMMPQTWKTITKISKTLQRESGPPTTIQAPSVVPAWDMLKCVT